MRRYAFAHGFSVDQQQPDFSIGEAIEVNDSHPAPLATTSTTPTDFPYASGPRHDIPTLWVSGDEGDKTESILIVPAVAGEADERRSFNNREHGFQYTAMP